MPITIRGSQIRDAAITNAKIAAGGIEPDRLSISGEVWDFATGTLRSATPAGDSDVATKGYVDGVAAGLCWKEPARAVAVGNITLSGTQTVDGTSLVADDRCLVVGQTDPTENGIYVVAAGAWARSADMDAGSEFPSAAVFVATGTANGDTGWVCTNDGAPTLGTTDIVFVQFSGVGAIVAGAGISKSGSTLAVEVTANAGLGFDAGGDGGTLEVKLDSNGGVQFATGAIALKLASNGGLFADAAGAKVLLDLNSGIQSLAGGLSLKLDTNSGLQSLAGGLSAKIKANAGLLVDGDGFSVKLDTNPGIQALAGGLSLKLDGASLSTGASGVSVAENGIGVFEQGFRFYTDALSGTTTHFDLSNLVLAKNYVAVRVYLNGQRIKPVESSPADEFEYTVTTSGLTTSIDLGAALVSGDVLLADYIAD